MDKEEIFKKFEENIQYLRRNIPPDDIYLFAEQNLLAALYFIEKWGIIVNDIDEECEKDPITEKWLRNILYFQHMRETGQDVQINLNFLGDE